jgi:uncharacterized protein YyaL (SSP411 family)
MAIRTLERMRWSGLFDHVGFGFFRYSTDGNWHLPHFEKTLYDQALMALAYIKAFAVTGQEEMKSTAEMILRYAERSLLSPQGLFYSAEGADSEGKEGKFYLWTLGELLGILGPKEFDILRMSFDIRDEGNFKDEATQRPTGLNLLDLVVPLATIAKAKDTDITGIRRIIQSSLSRMFDVRELRIHPDKDDKVLTDWNGIMIAAFAQAAKVFKDQRLAKVACNAADGIWSKMNHHGHLFHRFVWGEAAIDGFLDDYTHFTWGLLEIYQTTFNDKYLDQAIALTETALEHFADQKGGFFQTGDSSEEIIARLKEAYDGAIPSGNSVMAMNLVRLGIITGEKRYFELADSIFEAFAIDIENNPSAYVHLLSAYAMAKGQGFASR